MATVNHTVTRVPGVGDDHTRVVVWTPLTTANADGEFITVPEHVDVTLHVFGTVGAGGSIRFEGTNEIASATNVVVMHDPRGPGAGDLIFTVANAVRQVLTPMLRMRPFVSAGDGTTSFTVIAVIRRQWTR